MRLPVLFSLPLCPNQNSSPVYSKKISFPALPALAMRHLVAIKGKAQRFTCHFSGARILLLIFL